MLDIHEIFYGLNNLADKWEPYLDIYDTWFSRFREKEPAILEIGVYKGGSAELWSKYFGEGTYITGIDINPSCKEYQNSNFGVLIGDTGSNDFWKYFNTLIDEDEQQFDIIIDDGGHHMHQQIMTLKNSYKYLKDGGIYLCEDTHTSYYDHWPNAGYKNPNSFVEYSKKLIDVLSEEHQFKGPDGEVFQPKQEIDKELKSLYKEMKGIHFYNSVVVFEKGKQKPFKRIFSRTDEIELPGVVSGDTLLTIKTS